MRLFLRIAALVGALTLVGAPALSAPRSTPAPTAGPGVPVTGTTGTFTAPITAPSAQFSGPVVMGGTAQFSGSTNGDTTIAGPDGTIAALVRNVPSGLAPVEFLQMVPGLSGAGATLLCARATDPMQTVSAGCNFVASAGGPFKFAGGYGEYLRIIPPAVPVTAVGTISPGTASNFNTLQIGGINVTSTQANVALVPSSNGGASAGFNSFSSGPGVALGQNIQLFGGTNGVFSGVSASDLCSGGVCYAPTGGRCHMSGLVAASGFQGGGNQVCEQTLSSTTTTATAARMGVDNGASTSFTRQNSVPIRANGHGTLTAEVECSNGTSGDSATWLVRGTFSSYAGSLRLPYITGTGASLSGSTAAGGMGTMSLAVSADTTNGNINLTPTPPSGNTNTVSCTAYVRWMQRLS